MRVWTYVMTVDGGGAPNFDPPCATLAICKPRIRLGAEPGDAVLAFTGQRLGPEPHAVCWAGVIAEKLTFEDYWRDSRFKSKKPGKSVTPDNIYRPIEGGLLQVRNRTHVPEDFSRDTNGRFVLVFGQHWYYGPGGPILPDHFGLRMNGGRRGHRVINWNGTMWLRLQRWLENHQQAVHRPNNASCRPAQRHPRSRVC
jgi:hypothetical protein